MSDIDTIKAELESATSVAERIELLCKLSWEIRNNDPEGAAKWAHEALSLANSEQIFDRLHVIYNALGVSYKHLGNYTNALFYYELHLKTVLQKGKASLPVYIAYNNLGGVYTLIGDYDQAMEYYIKSLDIAESLKLNDRLGNCFTNIGNLLEKQGDLKKAIEFHNQALTYYEREEDHAGISYALNNKANVEFRSGNFQNALNHYHRSVLIKQDINDLYGIAHSYSKIGQIHKALEQESLALEYLYNALDIQEGIEDLNGITESLLNISQVFYQQGKLQPCIAFASKSVAIADKINSKASKHLALKGLSDAYQLAGDFRKAYQHYLEYDQLKEEIFNDEKIKAINVIQARYDAEKKDRKIEKLNKQKDILKSVNKELKLFASKASHDLRSPLRSIGGLSSLLIQQFKGDKKDESLKHLQMIQSSVDQMHQLLEDLLKYAKAGLNPDELTKIDLNKVLQRVRDNLFMEMKESNAVLNIEELPEVSATRTLMIQLFQNLIANAIKFRADGKTPQIQVGCKMKRNRHTFFVEDNGIGIPEKKLDHIFGIFTRLNSKSDFEGSGIGLATCKKIVENLGGKIWAESEPGKGTCFYFYFEELPQDRV